MYAFRPRLSTAVFVAMFDVSRYHRSTRVLEVGMSKAKLHTCTRMMSAPASANAIAIAAPMPLVPPVTRATRPSREKMRGIDRAIVESTIVNEGNDQLLVVDTQLQRMRDFDIGSWSLRSSYCIDLEILKLKNTENPTRPKLAQRLTSSFTNSSTRTHLSRYQFKSFFAICITVQSSSTKTRYCLPLHGIGSSPAQRIRCEPRAALTPTSFQSRS